MATDAIPLHGGQLREIAERFQVAEESLLDFSASISPILPGDAMIEELCELLRSRRVLTQYPESNYRELKDAIAKYAGVDHNAICVANGVMPLLDATVRASGLQRCLVLTPAFAEYQRVLTACGAEHFTLLLSEDNDFLLDPDLVLKAAVSSGADAVLLANPHSPSGSLAPPSILRQLQSTLARSGIAAIVDEAFIDFCPESSVSELSGHATNLVVLRSLTKFFAIPGLRIAYALAHPETRGQMESMLPLWPVDSLAAFAARLAMVDTAGVRERQEANTRERYWLREQLIALGWRVFPSSANYLLTKPPRDVDGLELWQRLIIEHRIVVRNCGTFEGLTETHFRVAIRDRLANMALISSLASLNSCWNLGSPLGP